MKLPITAFGPPKPEKEITRYFLLKARYKTTKKTNAGDGTSRSIRECLNEEMEYCNFTVTEMNEGKKLECIKVFSPNSGRPKGTKNVKK